MEMTHVMRTTGAVRSFTADPVPQEVLYRILDNARFAPSGANRQAWHVTVVRDLELRRRLAEASLAAWRRYVAEHAAGYRAFSAIEPAPASTPEPADLAPHPMFSAIERVPEVLVVSVDLKALAMLDRDLDRPSLVAGASIYPFVHNILLAARNEGLGGVLTTYAVAYEPELAPLLRLPVHHAIVALLGIGAPVHQVRKLSRRPVESFATIDRFDGPPLTA